MAQHYLLWLTSISPFYYLSHVTLLNYANFILYFSFISMLFNYFLLTSPILFYHVISLPSPVTLLLIPFPSLYDLSTISWPNIIYFIWPHFHLFYYLSQVTLLWCYFSFISGYIFQFTLLHFTLLVLHFFLFHFALFTRSVSFASFTHYTFSLFFFSLFILNLCGLLLLVFFSIVLLLRFLFFYHLFINIRKDLMLLITI